MTDANDLSIAITLGTRPEIIKLAPIIRRLGSAAAIIHTGQHYDNLLSEVFFADLAITDPTVRLRIGGTSRAKQIATALDGIDDALEAIQPDGVVAQGDTNTVAAAAVAANARELPFIHVEAGLRSFDNRMPEEHNRVIADHLSDLLLAPTDVNVGNLAREGIKGDQVVVTGNTIVEAVEAILPQEASRAAILRDRDLRSGMYVLCTLHRPENVDDPEILQIIIDQLGRLDSEVILPMHPRTSAAIQRSDLNMPSNIRVVPPAGYSEFLALGAESALVVSDSGGVQEEVSVYKRPLLVVRRSTERPEVLGTFAERVNPGSEISRMGNRWLATLPDIHERLQSIPSPYGGGDASAISVRAIERYLLSH